MYKPKVTDPVIRLDGGYRKGSTGTVVEVNNEAQRARVQWEHNRTWLKFTSLALQTVAKDKKQMWDWLNRDRLKNNATAHPDDCINLLDWVGEHTGTTIYGWKVISDGQTESGYNFIKQ